MQKRTYSAYMHLTHHGKEEAEHHKQIVVSRERYGYPEPELTEAGEHQDPHTADSGEKVESNWVNKFQ